MNSNSGIVDNSYFCMSELSRTCPHCLKWFALRLVEVKLDPVLEKLRVFQCDRCGKQTTYPRKLPDHVV